MTTKPKHEYILNIEHETGCNRKGDRTALFLRREIAESMDVYFASDEEGEYISADGRWTFEENLKPLMLRCSGCWGSRYLATDSGMNVIALTPDNCPRNSKAWGHATNWDRTPCEYCGHGAKS